MCRNLGWPAPRFFVEPDVQQKVGTAVDLLDETLAVSMGEIENADFILALGVDPVHEAPMLALAMRQAHPQGRHHRRGGPEARDPPLLLHPSGGIAAPYGSLRGSAGSKGL
jgi:hypothetical protein